MSAKELMVNGKPLSSLRVVDLKEELEKRGLSKSGSKKDLADRLRMNLLLENQRSCQGAADEEQLPNISTREQLAEQNPFIRDYFQSQAELYHSQKVVKKLYEGMSQTPEEGEQPPTPIPKENEEAGEQRSPSASEKPKPQTEPEPVEAADEKPKNDVVDSSNSNHIDKVVKDKVEESNGSRESEEIVEPKSQVLEVERKTSAPESGDQSEGVSKVEEAASEPKPPCAKDSVVSSSPQEESIKEPEVAETIDKVPEVVETVVKGPTVIEKLVKDPEGVEKHVDKAAVIEKVAKEPEVSEEVVKEPAIVEKVVGEPEVVEKPVIESKVVEKVIEEPEITEKSVKEPEVVEESVKAPVKEKTVKKSGVVEKAIIVEPDIVEKAITEEPEVVKKAIVEEPGIEESKGRRKDLEATAVENTVIPTTAVNKQDKIEKNDRVRKKDEQCESTEVGRNNRRLELKKRSKTPEEIPPEKVVVESKERKKRRASVSPEKSSPRKEEAVVEKSARFSPVRNDHNDEDLDYEDEESDEKRQSDESTWKRRNLRSRVRSFTPEKVKVEKPKSPISHKNEENSSAHKPLPISKSSPSSENLVVEKTVKPFPIRDQVDVDEVLDYGYEEADSKRDHEGVAWSRRILRLKNRCSVIEKTEKKWNRIDRKPVVVTSSVLETFFPDVKLLPESEVKLEERIPKEPEIEKERVKTERDLQTTQILDSNSTESNLPNIKRKISIIPFEETVKELTPPRNPPSKILVITNLTRPFTLMQLKELLQRTGTIEDIWVDKIKSKCLAKFEKDAEAEETRAALHGIKWPSSNPKALFVDFATESEFEDIRTKEAGEKKLKIEKPEEAKVMPVREWDLGKRSRSRSPGRTKGAGSGDRDRKRSRKSASPHSRRSPHHDKKSRDHDIKEEAQAKALDELFRKTTTTPCLYWLPLTPAQISEKEELRRKRMVERERRLAEMEKLRPR